MRPNTFTISRLAAAADVHVETVRYYQRRRLLRQPGRPIGGVRPASSTKPCSRNWMHWCRSHPCTSR